jgi:branched-chain amino acid transport system ATP-binding protein
MLEATGLTKAFGGLTAVDDASLRVPRGAIVGLIGPNGAGKTTLFALLSGFLKPDKGSVAFLGRDITGLPPHAICRLGMARTFQIVQPFRAQTVRENVMVGAYLRHADRAAALAHAEEVARQVGLAGELDKLAENLTIAGRKRLELARALATDPSLLLLDEVLAGLNPQEVTEVIPVIRGIASGRDGKPGVTVLMIEHVMQAVMNLADHIYVLANGQMIAEGAPADVTSNQTVIEAYLGQGTAERLRRTQGSISHAV